VALELARALALVTLDRRIVGCQRPGELRERVRVVLDLGLPRVHAAERLLRRLRDRLDLGARAPRRFEPLARGIDAVLLAAPGTAPDRLAAIAGHAHGFVYCVATYGVTGARDSLAATARDLVSALRPLTDLPLLVGVGIGTPGQAADACTFADGVIVGSALMARLVDGDRDGALELAAAFRAAIPR
jgi:hypothetical protein